jgi:hypothetical protein
MLSFIMFWILIGMLSNLLMIYVYFRGPSNFHEWHSIIRKIKGERTLLFISTSIIASFLASIIMGPLHYLTILTFNNDINLILAHTNQKPPDEV